MKKKTAGTVVLIVFVDLLLFAALLLSFSYFHHVRRMWFSDDIPAEENEGPGGIAGPGIASPSNLAGTENRPSTQTSPTTDNGTDADTNAEPDDTAEPGTETSEPPATETEPPETEPTEPKHKFEDLFAKEGEEPTVTDTMYRSHDIYMTVTEVTEPVSDYVARYYVYDIYVRYIENIFTTYSTTDTRYPFEDYVKSAGYPIAAISGDYWRLNADIAVRNGVTLSDKKRTEGDFCVMYDDGTIEMHGPQEAPTFEITDDMYQIWNFGPSLLDDEGHAKSEFGSWYKNITGRNPRSSMGYYEPYHYCFIVVDGRKNITYNGVKTYFKGIRFVDLAKIYESLGCKSAYCFDGGNSAYAYYNGELIRHQEPSDDMRKIYDIICVGEIGG